MLYSPGQINDPSSGKHYSLTFLLTTASCPSWTLNFPRALLLELQQIHTRAPSQVCCARSRGPRTLKNNWRKTFLWNCWKCTCFHCSESWGSPPCPPPDVTQLFFRIWQRHSCIAPNVRLSLSKGKTPEKRVFTMTFMNLPLLYLKSLRTQLILERPLLKEDGYWACNTFPWYLCKLHTDCA